LIPETKSIPLEHMDRLFEIKPVSKANKVLMDQLSSQGVESASMSADEKANRNHFEKSDMV
jgi:hypothetical protein